MGAERLLFLLHDDAHDRIEQARGILSSHEPRQDVGGGVVCFKRRDPQRCLDLPTVREQVTVEALSM